MIRALALAAALIALAACGQKGPLTLPEGAAKPAPAAASPVTPVAPTPPPGTPSSP